MTIVIYDHWMLINRKKALVNKSHCLIAWAVAAYDQSDRSRVLAKIQFDPRMQTMA